MYIYIEICLLVNQRGDRYIRILTVVTLIHKRKKREKRTCLCDTPRMYILDIFTSQIVFFYFKRVVKGHLASTSTDYKIISNNVILTTK